jgi:hypothetical protein
VHSWWAVPTYGTQPHFFRHVDAKLGSFGAPGVSHGVLMRGGLFGFIKLAARGFPDGSTAPQRPSSRYMQFVGSRGSSHLNSDTVAAACT